MNYFKDLKEIKGDASFRKFYRKRSKNLTSIIVFASKEKFKNLLVYDAINKILITNKILAPITYHENYNKNFIEIEDFGDTSIFKILKKKKIKKFVYFKKVIELLNKIQVIKNRKIKNFKKKNYVIPIYNKEIIIKEANLFCNWYLNKRLLKNEKVNFIKDFKKIIKDLTSKLMLKNDVFVHRDFHVSNLMLVKDRIGIIDSQDALIGNRAYDLASLVDDVRLQTSKSFKKRLYNFYLSKQKKINKKKFKNDFEILSVLRNLKIIGIFSRLAIRDGKVRYLKLIPHAWKLIRLRIKKNTVFNDLDNLLSKNFKGELNAN